MPLAASSTARDWLALGAASRLVGVDPATLRRWADEGRVVAFTTPGGHRRFDRRALERMAAARRPGSRGSLSLIGATPARLSKAYRRSYRADAEAIRSATSIVGPDRAAFRDDGRQLVERLLAYLDAPADDASGARRAAEDAAVILTDDLARRLAGRGVRLNEAAELFVAARRPFLAELGQLAGRRALDPAALSALYDEASGLLDRLLLRLISTHQEASLPTRGST